MSFLFTISLKYTKYEKARIIGARALQVSMGAPVLIEVPGDVADPVDIAELEFQEGAIPITVRRLKEWRVAEWSR